MMNKKGNLSITLLVLLVFILTIFLLYIFVGTSNSTQISVSDARFIEQLSLREEATKGTLSFAMKSALLASYSGVLQDIAPSALTDENNAASFVQGRVQEQLKSSTYQNNERLDIANAMKDGSFSLLASPLGIDLTTNSIPLTATLILQQKKRILLWELIPIGNVDEIQSLFGVVYRPNMSVSVKYSELGLVSPDKVAGAVIECRNAEDSASCVSAKLPSFSVVKSPTDSKILVFSTKQKYSMNGNIESLTFNVNMA